MLPVCLKHNLIINKTEDAKKTALYSKQRYFKLLYLLNDGCTSKAVGCKQVG